MSAATLALFESDDRAGLARWVGAALVVLAAHLALAAIYNFSDWRLPAPAPQEAAIMIELAPLPVAPASPVDLVPGPEQIESPRASPPPPDTKPELFEPLPKVETEPVVTLPLVPPQVREQDKPVEQKVEEPPPQVVRERASPPSPRTTAAPPSERRHAPVARAPSPGRAASAAPSPFWIGQLMAHINRHKRYPPSAQSARQQGSVTLSFTMSRSGQVLSRRIARSSGVPALDAEALAMIARAQPLPAFPASMPQASQHFSMPVHFTLR